MMRYVLDQVDDWTDWDPRPDAWCDHPLDRPKGQAPLASRSYHARRHELRPAD